MNNNRKRIADLSPTEKRKLLTHLLRQEAKEPKSFPLSFNQQQLWLLDQFEPDNPAYNLATAVSLVGSLNLPVLEQSFNEILRRHEALRTTFSSAEGRPTQIVVPSLNLEIPVIDIQELPEDMQESEVLKLATRESQHPFNLTQGPLLRVTLLRLGEKKHALLLAIHHIISDQWSIGILIQEVAILYKAFSDGKSSPLPEPPAQYTDFALWQRQRLRGQFLEEQLSYWKQQLSSPLPVLQLPTDRLRPKIRTFSGSCQLQIYPKGLVDSLKSLSQREGVTLFMTLLAAFKTLLYHYTAQDDIVVGSSIANRNQSKLENVMGFFANTLVFRTTLSGKINFQELLGRVSDVALEAYTHQDVPFEKLVEELQPERDQSHNPLFQVFFVLQNAPLGQVELPDLSLSLLEFKREVAMFDLTLSIEENQQELNGYWEYNSNLFDDSTISRMIERFQTLLESIVKNPSTPLNEFELALALESPPVLPVVGRSTRAPLSSHQERIWFIDQFETGNIYESSPVYHNIPLILHFKSFIDYRTLENSLNEVIARHEALRTRISSENNQIIQAISPSESCLKLKVVDVKSERDPVPFASLIEYALNETRCPFLLNSDSLIRATVFKFKDWESLLVVTVHHFIADKRSLELIAQELVEIYSAHITKQIPRLERLTLQHADYIHWQRNLPTDMLESLRLYWKRQLSGKLQPIELPLARPRPAIHTFTDARYTFSIDRKLTQRLEIFRQEKGFCKFVILLTCFKILLHWYARQDEIIVGTSDTSRDKVNTENTVGYFANLLVLRSIFPTNATFDQLLLEIDRTVKQARKHKRMPFDLLVQELNLEKDMSRTALFDILFQFEEQQPLKLERRDLKVQLIDTNMGYGKYDINLLLQNSGNHLSGTVVYNADIFDCFMIRQMMRHLKVILNAMITDPQKRIDCVNLLSRGEKDQQLLAWNETQTSYPRDKTIHQIFEEQTVKTPDKTAVTCSGMNLTYSELNERSNKLAHYLIQQGVVPNTLVALCLDRSLDMIICLLGILKAGGAYLPMDPTYPLERLHFMLQDAQISYVITTATLAEHLPAEIPSLILLDVDYNCIYEQPPTSPPLKLSPHNLAYCIYTSGSTGKPKGVLIEHQNVVRLVVNDRLQFTFTESDVWTMFHSYCFDFSVWEMYGSLLYGGRLVIVPTQVTKDPLRFLDLLMREKVTVLNQTPTFFYSLIQEVLRDQQVSFSLRYVIFGGEVLQPIQLEAWRKLYPGVKLINMYGITETTVHATFKEITEKEIQDNVYNIGTPIPTTKIYIMNSNRQLLPVGVPGEVYVGGDGVGRGYLGRDDLTYQKFILKNIFISQGILRNFSQTEKFCTWAGLMIK
jgi:amino acid adenylation domain-containing protein